MSADLVKAARRMAPYGDGTNASNVLVFTAGTASAADPLPDEWHGAYVTVRAVGGTVYWMVSKNSAATVDETNTTGAADGDPQPDRGKAAADAEESDWQLPEWDPNTESMYFVRAAGSALTIEVTKTSF